MKRFVEGTDRGQSTLFPECLDDWTRRHDKHEAMRLIGAASVPAGAVLNTGDLLGGPSFEKRGIIQTIGGTRRDQRKKDSGASLRAARPFSRPRARAERCKTRIGDLHKEQAPPGTREQGRAASSRRKTCDSVAEGTGSSNPICSSGESTTNCSGAGADSRRGAGETIRAALPCADLRDFTAVSEATEPAAMIATLDAETPAPPF
jgi:hypothetical protein